MQTDLSALVASYRILVAQGHGDGTLGHVSLLEPERQAFWLKRADIGMDEVHGPGDFLLVGLDGRVIEGEGPLHSEWPIHAFLLEKRPELRSVIHTHAPNAAILSATETSIQPISTEGGYFTEHPIRCHGAARAHIDHEGLGREVAGAVGQGFGLLLRNHGLIACGDSVEQATIAAVYLERAAAIQVKVLSARLHVRPAAPEAMLGRAAMLRSTSFIAQNFAYYARQLPVR